MRKFQLRPSSKPDAEDCIDAPAEVWIDIGVVDDDGRDWLANESGLPEGVVKRLLEPVPATYWRRFGRGFHFNVRTTAVAGEASKRVEFGIWLDPGRIITVRRGEAPELDRAAEACSAGVGPANSWGLILFAMVETINLLEQNLIELIAMIDGLEGQVLAGEGPPPIQGMAELQRQLIYARRFRTTPLADIVSFISSQPASVIETETRDEFEGLVNAITEHQNVLGMSMTRAAALQGVIRDQLADSMNSATYRFTWVATVFLPLSFLTGLLGINVAGIPGNHDPFAFWTVCGALCAIAAAWGVIIGRATGQGGRPRHSKDR